jgi:hypothetical protein
MLLAAVRRRVDAWRQPRQAARIARVLWIAWAIVVWNVVFDRVIVVAGRAFIVAASAQAAAAPGGPFADMDDWMRPAVVRGFWIATAACAGLVTAGLTAVNYAAPRRASGGPCHAGDVVDPAAGGAGTARDDGQTKVTSCA